MFSINKLSPSITQLLRLDHAQVLTAFHHYALATRPGARKALADNICDALEIHTALEEEIFYPVLRRLDPEDAVLQKSEPEHAEMHRMLGELRATDAGDARHARLINELMRDLLHHVADEETVLLAQAEKLLSRERLAELGAQMHSRRLSLRKTGMDTLPRAARLSGSATAIMVGVGAALMAARLIGKKEAT